MVKLQMVIDFLRIVENFITGWEKAGLVISRRWSVGIASAWSRFDDNNNGTEVRLFSSCMKSYGYTLTMHISDVFAKTIHGVVFMTFTGTVSETAERHVYEFPFEQRRSNAIKFSSWNFFYGVRPHWSHHFQFRYLCLLPLSFLLLYFIHSFMAPIPNRKIVSINETRKTRDHPRNRVSCKKSQSMQVFRHIIKTQVWFLCS